jgi:hypothetical protein
MNDDPISGASLHLGSWPAPRQAVRSSQGLTIACSAARRAHTGHLAITGYGRRLPRQTSRSGPGRGTRPSSADAVRPPRAASRAASPNAGR